jgi:hypothetical protein
MAIWFNWRLVAPLMERYIDDGTRDLCTTEIVAPEIGTFKLSFVGTPNRVELIRSATLDSDGKLSDRQIEILDGLNDHALAILKLTHDSAADLVRFGDNTISIGAHDQDGKPNLNISINEIKPEQKISAQNICNVLASTMEIRPLFKLLADTQTPTLPLQYRYLSLYKMFELEFRKHRKWTGLRELFASHEDDYSKLNISKSPLLSLFHDMRDKCAHAKIGGEEKIGIMALNNPDAKVVQSLLPFLLRIITEHITTKVPGLRFSQTHPGNS